ncbi:biliverdin-producing heme oxygenase [Lamprobacter modestohalophilus]|uniref:biliverdin-producing heme oxygenase n=1 Tax=Lamprobacter modestohalophilus TaxID=1064514 RepID=UPI001902EDF3|nr:biliverdin-producing heme oxygenase [Lamprobacter modestohalophilus]
MTKPQHSSLHQRLKANTTAWHSRLDSTPGLRQLIRPELTLTQYVAALQGLLDAHRRVEHQLQQLADDHPGICPNGLPAYRPRVPALLSDLSRLASKTDPTRTSTSTTAPISAPPAIRSAPEPAQSQQSPTASALASAHSVVLAQARYLGMRYVLEGATQGGKMISARVTAQLPQLLTEQACAYWTLLDAASTDWTALARSLARPAEDAAELAAITAGAVHAYQCFLDTFDPSTNPTVS